ncbi:MAG: hypothetical protein EA384_15515 [Spirochaetaceae bacterium]|nr:MAG: hypothetical protein EA384_15515 [Spirochaetaceae bacterium]
MVCRRRNPRRRITARLVARLAFAMLLALRFGAATAAQDLDLHVGPVDREGGHQTAQEAVREPSVPRVAVLPQRVAEGGRFAVTIEIEPVDAGLVEVEEPDYPPGVTRVGGVQVTSRAGRPADTRSTQIRVDFQAARAGRWIIEPFSVRTPLHDYITEPAVVEIALRDDPSTVPYDLEWRLHSDPIIEGQSVAVTLDMVNVTEFTFPEQISVQPPSGALFEEVQGVGEIESARYGDVELFRVPVASYLLTPSAAGSLTLPVAEIRAFGLTRRAAAKALTIEPLPEGAGESAAVGDFSFRSHLSHSEIGLDEAIELAMQVRGVGNLGFLQFPEVSAEGLVVSETETSEDMLAGPGGYIGTRAQIVRMRPTGPGEFRVTVGPFSWYDPQRRIVRRETARAYPVRVVDRSEAAPAQGRQLPPLLSAEQVRRAAPLDLFRLPGTYLTTMPGLIMVTVVIYVRRRRREGIALFSVVLLLGAGILIPAPSEERLEQLSAHYDEGEYTEAHRVALQLLQEMPGHPGLLYNSGVTAFAAHEHAHSVLYLRQALVMRPLFGQARETLKIVEGELGLDRQYALPRAVHPDVPLIAALMLFYVLAVLLVIPPRRRRAGYAISVIVALFSLAGTLSLFGYSLYVRQQPAAIVGPQTAGLKRIPEEGAQIWLNLEAGTAVRPLASRNDYTLIRTGYGLDGWMRAEYLLQHGEPR